MDNILWTRVYERYQAAVEAASEPFGAGPEVCSPMKRRFSQGQAMRSTCVVMHQAHALEFEELMRYKEKQKLRSSDALTRLSDLSEEMGGEL